MTKISGREANVIHSMIVISHQTVSFMKDFFKTVFASALGFVLGSVILVFLFIAVISAVIAAVGSSGEVTIQDNTVLQLTFDQPITERTSNNPLTRLSFSGLDDLSTPGLSDILKDIEKAGRDSQIKGILLDLTSVSAGMATLEEIRHALMTFKKTGKFIYAYGSSYSQGAYYLATAADRIYLQPQGAIDFKGLRAELMFFKGALEKLDIEAQIIRHGKFKSAIEPFILDKMSPENREQIQTMMNALWNNMLTNISESRHIPIDSLQQYADDFRSRNAGRCLSSGLIDKVAQYDELLADMRTACSWNETETPRMVSLSKYDKAIVKSDKEFSSKKIAVIYAVGEIVDGKGDEESIGSTTTAAEIRKARLDSSIKAIVLRINSPGGSALASDIIWREVVLARKVKPVVASMSDVAASGGYYIACATDSIVAQPNTITGSIGVFGMVFNTQQFFQEKLGITFDTVKTSHYADLAGGIMSRPLREDEKALLQEDVEQVYDVFISHVAEGRHMDKSMVDSIGQGRVWSGTDALRIGLVDRLGTLDDAVAMAARMARLDTYRTIELPRQKEFLEKLLSDLNAEAETYFLKREWGPSYRYYAALKSTIGQSGILARVPYSLDIQ